MTSLALRAQAEQIADAYYPAETGRPSKLTDPDAVEVFLAAIADGNYRETACKLAGISKMALKRWLDLAETGDEAGMRFRDALEKCEALAESETVRNVRQASKLPQFWAAGMTWLERKSPDRWGRRNEDGNTPKVVVQIGVSNSDVTINASLSPVPRNELDQVSTGQVMHESLIRQDYVNRIEGEAQALEAPDPARDPTGVGGSPLAVRGEATGNRGRGGRKKKG